MRKYILLLICVIAISFDIVTKYLAEGLLVGGNTISLISDFLQLHLSYNSGVAFSLPIHGIPLQILTGILILSIVYQYISVEYNKNSHLLDVGYILILAGALPHAYERIFVGHVIDFIAVKYFAILNFADIFISVGVFLLILYYVRYEYARKS